jgi:transcriptional regulator with XRE-family HTH domain
MPASAPPSGPKVKELLRRLGQRIREHRKELKVSTVGTAEAAGVSRMTLNRIESGEPSVTMGAYLNVIASLGLELHLSDAQLTGEASFDSPGLNLGSKILISEYPQLKKLAWQIKKTKELSPQEALNIYERNWRHIDVERMSSKERKFIERLLKLFDKERLLV